MILHLLSVSTQSVKGLSLILSEDPEAVISKLGFLTAIIMLTLS